MEEVWIGGVWDGHFGASQVSAQRPKLAGKSLDWQPVDPVVGDPVREDNDKI